MFDNSRDCIAIALMALGYDINTTDASQITEAVDLLVKQKAGWHRAGLCYGSDLRQNDQQ